MKMKEKNLKNLDQIIKKAVLESLELVLRKIDGDDVQVELNEKVNYIISLDPEKGRKIKSIVRE